MMTRCGMRMCLLRMIKSSESPNSIFLSYGFGVFILFAAKSVSSHILPHLTLDCLCVLFCNMMVLQTQNRILAKACWYLVIGKFVDMLLEIVCDIVLPFVHGVLCSRELIFVIFREVGPNLSVPDGAKVISAKGMLVLPGRNCSLRKFALTYTYITYFIITIYYYILSLLYYYLLYLLQIDVQIRLNHLCNHANYSTVSCSSHNHSDIVDQSPVKNGLTVVPDSAKTGVFAHWCICPVKQQR